MFASYKKHNNQLYNNLVKLSRNKFFYEEAKIEDRVESRILLIFFHFALLLNSIKSSKKQTKTQEIFDNIFQNIQKHTPSILIYQNLIHYSPTINKIEEIVEY